ncbi:Unconventional myosin-VIIa [Homalodisca vitripennis]|nr:Unconventional myosin-VIIa [Homalodisca vitripennis]
MNENQKRIEASVEATLVETVADTKKHGQSFSAAAGVDADTDPHTDAQVSNNQSNTYHLGIVHAARPSQASNGGSASRRREWTAAANRRSPVDVTPAARGILLGDIGDESTCPSTNLAQITTSNSVSKTSCYESNIPSKTLSQQKETAEIIDYDKIDEHAGLFNYPIKCFVSGQSQRFLYELMYMRKVWLTMVPGKDRIADVVCHYPQEVPKYILGYQKCSKSDAAVLGALIFRADNGDRKLDLLDDSKKLMAKLVPPYHLKLQSNKEWKKAISEVYKKQMGMTSEDAKINYLRFVFPWSTFGSSFFDVKQTTEKRFPENITIAINKNGIFILDRQTREPLTLYPFTEVTSWTTTKSTFSLDVSSVRLVCVTPLGYKMDDLITSYTSLLGPRNNGV